MPIGPTPGRCGAIVLAAAMFVAPFIALLFSAGAGLVVMAVALAAGSMLLHDALGLAPAGIRRWLGLAVLVNLALAVACVAFAAWFWTQG